MPFTIRSLFQQGNNEGRSASATGLMEPGPPQIALPPNGGLPVPMSSPFGMEVPAASPFGGSLFKTREADAGGGTPVPMRQAGGSPFSPIGVGHSAGITVADVLPQLPPELAKANSLPPDQPIAIAPHLIEAALSNGQAAIPIFEIYRVCPAIFQSPVSPHDPRQVPLPAAKLPSLIAASQNYAQAPTPFAQAGAPPAMASAPSPFGNATAFNPGAAPQTESSAVPRMPVALPPRRETGAAPPMTGAPSPFGMASAFAEAQPSPFGQASPFAMSPAETATAMAPAQPSPFTFQPAQSPVAVTPQVFGATAVPPPPAPPQLPAAFAEITKPPGDTSGTRLNTLFGVAAPPAQNAAPSPFGMTAAAPPADAPTAAHSPFGASPFGQTAPPPFALTEPPPAQPSQAPAPSPFHTAPAPAHTVQSSPSPAPAGGAPLKLSLANLLKGYSSSDLGFEPGMVPSWIMTSVPSSAIQEQMAAGSAQIELGLLIDGTTDVGFRNVLSGARRDLRINLPANELFHSLPVAGPPSAALSKLAHQPVAAVQPPPMMAAHTPPSPLPVQASQPLNPFAAAKLAQSGPLMQAPGTSGPIQPKPNAIFGFATATPPAAQAPAPAPLPESQGHSQAPARSVTAFDPFAASTQQSWSGQTSPAVFPQPHGSSDGFSSDQLFGAPPPPHTTQPQSPAIAVMPEPAPPIAFTALPGIPPPPAQLSGSRFLTGTALQSSAPQPSFLPPPVLNPFSGPLKASAPPVQSSAFAAPAPLPPAVPAFAIPAPLPSAPLAFSAPVPPPSPPAPPPQASGPILGITPVAMGDEEQTMLRALLGVNEYLTVGRVVDLISRIPGIAACSCVNGASAVSHGGSSQTAQDFQKQAGDLARSIHALAPLIGIADAETFSINTNDRLMTFSFHPPIALGVLHQDNDLAAGLRDKITLVGRELARMVAKTGGHIV